MKPAGSPDIVLIIAPIGGDATNIRDVLSRAHHAPLICRTDNELRAQIAQDCGAIVLTEEAVTPELAGMLAETFAGQPAWSDIPIILIASMGVTNAGPHVAARLRGPRRTVTLLERPLRSATLLTALDTVLAARHRQYEIRELLRERDALLNSLESRVADRTAELQRLVEEMEAFSYSVSHDLRSPLRSLDGFARALLEDYGTEIPEGARSYLDKIARAAQRMDALTQDVLAYTRISRGDMTLGPVNLDDLVREVIEQYPMLEAISDSIHLRCPLGYVVGHVPSLTQVFSNLLGNAAKFTAHGAHPYIEVEALETGEFRRIWVRDNGIGIRPADQERIFRMFERAAGNSVPGTGIGLAIVRKAVERMGGKVGVQSAPGAGASFWFELRSASQPHNGTAQVHALPRTEFRRPFEHSASSR